MGQDFCRTFLVSGEEEVGDDSGKKLRQ